MNEFEKSFKEDIRTKKQAASGVHGKTGKRGLVGSVKTPADLLRGKERKAYEGTSPVTVSSIYDHLISLDEFKSLSRHKKMVHIHEYRQRFTAKEIAEKWGVSDKSIYYYYRAYGNLQSFADSAEQDVSTLGNGACAASKASPITNDEPTNGSNTKSAPVCRFIMTGEYEGSALIRKLDGLTCMTTDGQRYQVEICISEVTPS